MKTIIAGSRGITDYKELQKAISAGGIMITSVISGTAAGVDRLGEEYASEYGLPLYKYPAEWDRYGKSAGYRRNEQMADEGEALLAIWDGTSRGTKHMIDIARRKGLKIYVHTI